MTQTWARRRAVLLDLLERAGWSAGQVFLATLLAGGTSATVGNLPWRYSATLGLGAGVMSLLLTVVQYLSRVTNLSFWPDLVVRLGKTFLASLAGSAMAGEVFNIMTFNWTSALNVAFLATLTALGKGLLARGTGDQAQTGQRSPSTLSDSTYDQAVRTT